MKTVTPLRAIVYGCGPIGLSIARLASERPYIKLVGALDTDKGKVGKRLKDIDGSPNRQTSLFRTTLMLY